MKTLIAYGTTYGFSADCARKLAGQVLGETVLVNLVKEKAPSLDLFDNVVVGGSVYMGRVQKQVAEFCNANLNKLLGKRVALFICGGMPGEYEKNLGAAYPAPLLNAAISKKFYGGELRREKMSLGHRMFTAAIAKAGQKNGTPEPKALPLNIASTAQALNALQ